MIPTSFTKIANGHLGSTMKSHTNKSGVPPLSGPF
jgi:hypothetical protein